ncbi:hypothetical protein [Halomonas cupida]|uniref:hypothetical protein n=1 Tax=Halomonas cupida TaxID=44933 RepID=UPI003A92C213
MFRVGAAALFVLFSSDVFAMVDVYPGTITIEGDKVILTRCDLVSNRYTLISEQHENESLIDQLPEEIGIEGEQVTANVLAKYEEKNGENILVVNELKDVRSGSCHLMDALFK